MYVILPSLRINKRLFQQPKFTAIALLLTLHIGCKTRSFQSLTSVEARSDTGYFCEDNKPGIVESPPELRIYMRMILNSVGIKRSQSIFPEGLTEKEKFERFYGPRGSYADPGSSTYYWDRMSNANANKTRIESLAQYRKLLTESAGFLDGYAESWSVISSSKIGNVIRIWSYEMKDPLWQTTVTNSGAQLSFSNEDEIRLFKARNSEALRPWLIDFEKELETRETSNSTAKNVSNSTKSLVGFLIKGVRQILNEDKEHLNRPFFFAEDQVAEAFHRGIPKIRTAMNTKKDKTDFLVEAEERVSQAIDDLDTFMHEIRKSELFEQTENNESNEFLASMFAAYFPKLPETSKKDLLLSLIDEPCTRSEEQLFYEYLNHSGPIFRKYLQIVAREKGLPKSLSKSLRKLESSGKPLRSQLVNSAFEAQFKGTATWDMTPLGTGTLAQVHRGLISNRPVAIRILKPDAASALEWDENLLQSIADTIDLNAVKAGLSIPKIKSVLPDLKANIAEELNLQKTYENQKKGIERYHGKSGVLKNGKSIRLSVPSAEQPKPGEKLYIQELVSGVKLEALGEDQKKGVASFFAKEWYRCALIAESGFFHSDPHMGNLIAATSPSGDVTLHVLDFGMASQLNSAQQLAFLKLAVAQTTGSLDSSAEILFALAKPENRVLQLPTLKQLFRDGKSRKTLSIDTLFKIAMDAGLTLPSEIVSFQRGRTALSLLLQSAGFQPNEEKLLLMSFLTENMGALAGKLFPSLNGSFADLWKRFATTPSLSNEESL